MNDRENQACSWAACAYSQITSELDIQPFAIGDTCVATIFYQDYFEDMTELSFGMLRKHFDTSIPDLIALASRKGWHIFAQNEQGKAFFGVSKNEERRVQETLAIYPFDNVPSQNILRFKILKEAKRAKTSQDFARLQRYKDIDTGFVARLVEDKNTQGFMGERTIQQKTIATTSIFPLRKIPFQGVLLYVPANVSSWVSEPTPARQEITTLIQEEGLKGLEVIKEVCDKLNITFFLVGGTQLGAIRHKGFIPWDDDVDVGMLRGDYEKFIKHAQSLLPKDYFVQLPSTDRHVHFVYARLRYNPVKYITLFNENKDFNKGLWVDIFPFDAAPNNGVLAKLQCRLARTAARGAMGLKRRKEYCIGDLQDRTPLVSEDARYLRRYAFWAKLFPVGMATFFYKLFACCLNPFKAKRKTCRYASFIPTYTTIEPGDCDAVQLVEFEGSKMPVMQGVTGFLERQYGNYMELPALHMRQTDHGLLRIEKPDGSTLEP